MSRRFGKFRTWLLLALALTGAGNIACGQSLGATKVEAGSASANVAEAAEAPAKAVVPTIKTAPPIAEVTQLESAFERAASEIGPSVVSIVAVKTMKMPRVRAFPFEGTPFEDFFFDRRPQPRGDLKQQGLGSGVIVSPEGYVLTNNHVVDGAEEIEVHLHDDRKVAAEVVGSDPHTDIAVIKIETDGLQPASLGDSEQLKPGQWVMAAGSPFGLSKSVSAGIVSAVGRGNVGITDYENFIQTDATINPGNSGGPLVDLQGRVVGINTAIASRSGGSNGIGFAVPINMARSVMEQLVSKGKVVRGWLGVMIGALTPELAESFGYEGDGILVQDVLPDGPAKSSLESGDIILEKDGEPVKDVPSFRTSVAQAPPGTKIALKIWRKGKTQNVDITLGELPENRSGTPTTPLGKIGIALGELTDEIKRQRDIKSERGAVITRVNPGSVAERAGLRPGDVIEEVAGEAVKSAADADAKLRSADLEKGVRLRVVRGKYGHFVILRARK